MRSLDETRSRWQATRTSYGSLADLRRSMRYEGSESPAVKGCRSVCWKALLLSVDTSAADWSRRLGEARESYSESRNLLLNFIKHPEALATLNVDPLTDDPKSPWNSLREDEAMRAEIAQDVHRLPDEPFYHEPRVQTMIIDILFVHCKLNPKVGGYRQGMHELLAPILCVVEADAVERGTSGRATSDDELLMMDVLDAAFVEHDTFALFSKIMERAGSFYEVNDGLGKNVGSGSSVIVEKSKYIHERCLMKTDPELASHLKSIEILPQIFLIRWIRLLFGREFPFDQLLILWDTLFAVDPKLDLVDLICVAMLIRIRWDLLEADYSVCLQLLLKYPVPSPPHGPHTFVEDALYLRDHLNPSGAKSLVMKYTGRMPTPVSSARPSTPNFQGLGSLRLGTGRGSPLPSPSRFVQSQGGMEALFQNATKGVLERGEKLGINQAVRDAMGEIRRNMQNLQEARPSGPRRYPPASPLSGRGGVAALEKRNKQLAAMLDEIVGSLKAVMDSNIDDKAKSLELIELVAAKVQFVKIYLEDSSMEVPEIVERPNEGKEVERVTDVKMDGGEAVTPTLQTPQTPQTPLLPKTPVVEPDPMPAISTLSISEAAKKPVLEPPISVPSAAVGLLLVDAMDTDLPLSSSAPSTAPKSTTTDGSSETAKRPGPIPTRSTLAQSSFAWMLEPDSTPHSQTSLLSSSSPASVGSSHHRKRLSGHGASRSKNSFLFGEVIASSDGENNQTGLTSDEIFGLEPLRSRKARTPL